VLDEDGRPLSLGDAACQARLTAFQSIEAGDRVVRVCGYGLRAGAGLCHCLCLRFASGRAFCVAGSDVSRRGPAFDYASPPGCAVIALRFGGGTCRGLDVAATTLYASYNIREHRLLKSRTVWKSNSELGYRQPERHRADAVARGARNLISTQVANGAGGHI
jgi:hypothetical protein